MKKKLFIIDIDGTIIDSMGRVKRISKEFNVSGPTEWKDREAKKFLEEWDVDKQINGSWHLLKIIKQYKASFLFLTGRSEYGRGITEKWFRKHMKIELVKPEKNGIKLYMRSEGDFSPGSESKLRIFENDILPNHDGEFIFLDDDAKCLAAFSKYGICLTSPFCWDALYTNI